MLLIFTIINEKETKTERPERKLGLSVFLMVQNLL